MARRALRRGLAAATTGMAVVTGWSTAALAGPDVAYGEYLSNECVTCHQRTGNFNGIPSITGWPQETFVQALNAYRWRERKNPIMQTIADNLTEEDMAALAAYFEQLGPPKMTEEEPAKPEKSGTSDKKDQPSVATNR